MGLDPGSIALKPKLVVFALLLAISLYPVRCRPSDATSLPQPQLSQNLNDETEQLVPEFEERELLEDEDEYPQNDAPVDDNGPRKLDNRHARPHHVRDNSRRIISEQLTPVLKPVSEANDSLPGLVHEFNTEEFNSTFIGDQGDNSSLTDENVIRLSKNNRESQEFDHSERNRELRLNAIKELIQSYRSGGVDPKPTKLPMEVFEKIVGKLNITQPPPMDAYPMKRRSYHPSCNLPNNTDVEMWADSDSMNLLFNLTYSAPQNTTITIIAATLRLYKFSQGNHNVVEPSCNSNAVQMPIADFELDELMEPQRDGVMNPELNIPLLPATQGTVGLADDDKQIRVSVYWYTRSLKKNKVKRKLLDSRMLSVYGKEEWVEFNVRHAARQWQQLGKNFGLVVEVENEDGELLKASDYFKTMNCSNEASTAKPIPGVLLQAFQSIIESNNSFGGTGLDISALLSGSSGFIYTTANGNSGGGGRKRDLGDEIPAGKFSNSPYVYSILFPVIDLCTVEIPSKEASNAAFLQHSQYLLTQHLSACKNSNKQNQTDLLTHGTSGQIIQAPTTATDLNDTFVESQENLNKNNISHVHHEAQRKEHHHSNHHTAHFNPQEEISLQDTPHEYKLRHSRHKHRSHNNNNNNNDNHFVEETLRRRNNDNEEHENEREEIKEEVTLTDELGHELRKKVILKEVFRSTTHHESAALPQHDSNR